MAGPNAGMKISKVNGITFESGVDHVKFTLEELIHAANKDVAKFLRREVANKIFETYKPVYVKGAIKNRRNEALKKKWVNATVQYWARKKELDLIIGYKNYNWMTQQELGEYGYERLGILRDIVMKNIANINKIQAQYLTELNNDSPNTDNGIPDIGDGDDV